MEIVSSGHGTLSSSGGVGSCWLLRLIENASSLWHGFGHWVHAGYMAWGSPRDCRQCSVQLLLLLLLPLHCCSLLLLLLFAAAVVAAALLLLRCCCCCCCCAAVLRDCYPAALQLTEINAVLRDCNPAALQ